MEENSKNIGYMQKNSPYFTPTNSGNAFLLSMFFVFLFTMLFGQVFKINDNYWHLVALSICNQLLFVIVVLIMQKTSNAFTKLKPLLKLKHKPDAKVWAISLVAILIVLCSVIMLNAIFTHALHDLGGFNAPLNVSITQHWWQWIVAIIVICVLPCIFEEVIFRGMVYSGLRRYGFWVSIMLSSFFFMAMHGNLYNTFYQFMLGVMLALAMRNTGDLRLPMAMHFLSNLAVLVLNALFASINNVILAPWFISVAVIAFIFGIGIIAVYGFVMNKICKTTKMREDPEKVVEDTKIVPIIAVVVACMYIVLVIVVGFVTKCQCAQCVPPVPPGP